MKDRHLISEDELRAAGALDVPPAWRRSLSSEPELPLFPDDDLLDEAEAASSDDADEDESSEMDDD